MLHSSWNDIVLQEYPGEIALAISLSGCKLVCKGCHSPETFHSTFGKPITPTTLYDLLAEHKHITAIVFYGGEWSPIELLSLISIAKLRNLKTCLYTGLELDQVPGILLGNLDMVKTGPYVQELGGIDSPTTNQRFVYLKDKEK